MFDARSKCDHSVFGNSVMRSDELRTRLDEQNRDFRVEMKVKAITGKNAKSQKESGSR